MGLFKVGKFTDKDGIKWKTYQPTIYKKGSVNIKNKDEYFLKRLTKR